jgi:hypothetical protein
VVVVCGKEAVNSEEQQQEEEEEEGGGKRASLYARSSGSKMGIWESFLNWLRR